MLTDCRLIVDPPATGAWNMALDEALLADAAETGTAALRFYHWSEPTLSLGYFQGYDERWSHSASKDCAVVRRQSGGGAILHDRELTYSVALPPSHPLARRADEIYSAVHRIFIELLQPQVDKGGSGSKLAVFAKECQVEVPESESISGRAEPFLCFQRRACGDVILQPSGASDWPSKWKILGSAQRRHRGAILQHGSLLFGRSRAAPELPGLVELSATEIPIVALIEEFGEQFAKALQVRLFRPTRIPETLLAAAREIERGKYGQDSWTKRR